MGLASLFTIVSFEDDYLLHLDDILDSKHR